ncbi:MAG: molybdenum cofactor biosynthesis protein MoaE [Pseudomonadota bacterium]
MADRPHAGYSSSVQEADFDLAREVDAMRDGRTDIGAVVTFTGTVRDMHGDTQIADLTLEHYPGMTEKALDALARDAAARFPLLGCRIVHRVGTMRPGDNIVLVVTCSAHRQAAFDAAMFMMDDLKMRAPFWKKETRAVDGAWQGAWVDARESDAQAAAKWADASPRPIAADADG